MEFLRRLISSRKVKTAVLIALTVLYFLGLIAFFFNPALGTILWSAALIPSIMIFIYQKRREREEQVRKAEEEALKEAGEDEPNK